MMRLGLDPGEGQILIGFQESVHENAIALLVGGSILQYVEMVRVRYGDNIGDGWTNGRERLRGC